MSDSRLLSEHVAGARYEDLPAQAVAGAKRSLLDALGVMLAASGLAEECRPFVQLAVNEGGSGASAVLGISRTVSAHWAAFANGSMAHALDFEDTHDEARVHPNAAAVPAALALLPSQEDVSGGELLVALAVACDLVCRLGLALEKDPIEHGWYMPPILGAFGATAAAGRLLKLTPLQLTDAFALTLCQSTCSAELVASPESTVRAVRDAFAARAGVVSAQLAALGARGFEHPFEGDAGLFPLYAREDYDLDALFRDLGSVFEGANVSYEPWPSCRGTHAFIEAALELCSEHEFSLNEIERIHLTTGDSPLVRSLCEPPSQKRYPANAIQAKFSLPFTVALGIAHEDVRLRDFSSEAIAERETLELARRVSWEIDSDLDASGGVLKIDTTRGMFWRRVPALSLGPPSNPISHDALVEKFLTCARYAAEPLRSGKLEEIVALVFRLEEDAGSVGRLVRLLSQAGRSDT